MYAILPHVRVDSVCTAVPAREVRIDDELEHYGGSQKKADRARTMIGTDRRRIAYPDIVASDLCFAAAQRLLDGRGIGRDSIDALVFVSQSADYDLPATACVLQHELGLSQECAAFDVNQGCAGYVYGLWLASSLISARSCRRVLLLVGDASAVPRNPGNRITSPIFGDGGSATLLEWDERVEPLCFALGTDGAGFDAIIVPGGRARVHYSLNFMENQPFFTDVPTEQGVPWRINELYMDGAAVFDFTLRVIPEHLQKFMRHCQTAPEAIDWLILHQANRQIIRNIAEKTGFPHEKVPWETFSRYGNLSSASIPAALCDTLSAQDVPGNTKLLLCGFGVGLSWASCLMQTEGIVCMPVFDVNEPRDRMTNAGRIQYWSNKLAGEKRDESV